MIFIWSSFIFYYYIFKFVWGILQTLKMVRGTEEIVQQLEQRTWLLFLALTVTRNSRTQVTEDSVSSPCVHWHMVILSYAVNSRPTWKKYLIIEKNNFLLSEITVMPFYNPMSSNSLNTIVLTHCMVSAPFLQGASSCVRNTTSQTARPARSHPSQGCGIVFSWVF